MPRVNYHIPYGKLVEINLDHILQRLFSVINDVPNDVGFQEYQKKRECVLRSYEKVLQTEDFYNNQMLKPKHSHDSLFHVMRLVYTKKRILFSIDIEAYEFRHDIITEIGISIYDPRAHYHLNQCVGTAPIKKIHIIVKENKHFRNGKYVRDNRDNFLGGPSLVMPLREAAITVQLLINHYFPQDLSSTGSASFGVSLVGHDVGGDIKWLQSIGVVFPSYVTNSKLSSTYIFDTQKLWKLSFGDKHGSLWKLLSFFDIPNGYLHNGANDSLFTLILLLTITDPKLRILKNFDKINQYFVPEEITFGKKVPPATPAANFTADYTCSDVTPFYKEDYFKTLHEYVDASVIAHSNIQPNLDVPNVGKAIEYIFQNYF